MIAVLADDAERAVVSEFFELFKTPWEFYRSDLQYDVLICSHAQFRNSSAKLVLIYGDGHRGFEKMELKYFRNARTLSLHIKEIEFRSMETASPLKVQAS